MDECYSALGVVVQVVEVVVSCAGDAAVSHWPEHDGVVIETDGAVDY